MVMVAFPAGADLEPILTIPLEEKSEAADIGVGAGPPCSSRIFRSHVVDHSHLCEVVGRFDIHGLVEVVLGKAKGDRQAGH